MRVHGILTADTARRQLAGRLLPWNVEGHTSRGPVRFTAGALRVPTDPTEVVLNLDHDRSRPVGRMSSAHDDGTGILATFDVAATPAGDQVLAEAAAGLRAGLSVECDELDLDWSSATVRGARLT